MCDHVLIVQRHGVAKTSRGDEDLRFFDAPLDIVFLPGIAVLLLVFHFWTDTRMLRTVPHRCAYVSISSTLHRPEFGFVLSSRRDRLPVLADGMTNASMNLTELTYWDRPWAPSFARRCIQLLALGRRSDRCRTAVHRSTWSVGAIKESRREPCRFSTCFK